MAKEAKVRCRCGSPLVYGPPDINDAVMHKVIARIHCSNPRCTAAIRRAA